MRRDRYWGMHASESFAPEESAGWNRLWRRLRWIDLRRDFCLGGDHR